MRRGLAAGAGLGVVILLIAELWLRIAAFGWSSAALGPWQRRIPWDAIRTVDGEGVSRPRPGSAARWGLHPGEPPVEYRFDAHGFRTVGPQAPPARDACRVLVIGESNAFGYAVPAEDAFPVRLAVHTQPNGRPLAVANAATWGTNVAQQGRLLLPALETTDPEVVLVTVSPWSLRLDPYPGGPEGVSVLEKIWNVLDGWSRRLAATSAVADRVRRRALHVMAARFAWPPPSMVAWELAPLLESPARFATRWEGVARVLREAIVRIRSRGAEPVLVYVPLDLQVDRSRNRLYRNEALPYASHGFEERDYTRDDRYPVALASLAAELDVELVDTTAALRAVSAPFLPRDYHLGRAGYDAIVTTLAPVVQAACRRRAEPR